MFLTNVLLKKSKSKFVVVLMESLATGHKYNAVRARLGDKLEDIKYDPWIQQMSVYKELKKIKSIRPAVGYRGHYDYKRK